MRRSIAITFAMMLVCTGARAQEVPGIDRPRDEVATKLASIFHCRMRSGQYASGCRSNPQGASVGLSRNSDHDVFDTADFSLLIARRSGSPTAEERRAVEIVIDAIVYLAPSWPNASDWLRSAIEAAGQQRACSYMKIDGVAVSIMPHRAADTEGSFASIYVTRLFDLYSLCEY